MYIFMCIYIYEYIYIYMYTHTYLSLSLALSLSLYIYIYIYTHLLAYSTEGEHVYLGMELAEDAAAFATPRREQRHRGALFQRRAYICIYIYI